MTEALTVYGWLLKYCRRVVSELSHCCLNLYDVLTSRIHCLHIWAGNPSPEKSWKYKSE